MKVMSNIVKYKNNIEDNYLCLRQMKSQDKYSQKQPVERNPKLWGKHLWLILHWMTYMYPQYATRKDENEYRFFFEKIIPDIIPCKSCSVNLLNHIREYPINFKSKESLVLWLCHIHNMVNKSLKKKEYNCNQVMKKMKQENVKKQVDASLTHFNLFMRDHVNFGTTYFAQSYNIFLRIIYKYNNY